MAKRQSPRNPGINLSRVKYKSTSPLESHFRKSRVRDEDKKAEGMCKRMTECWMDAKAKCRPRKGLEEFIKQLNIRPNDDWKWAT